MDWRREFGISILHRVRRGEISWCKLTGDTSGAERAKLVASFQEGRIPVFLISLKADGSGLNLTAADTVIHYDPWWNLAVEEQATGRAHRMGLAIERADLEHLLAPL
jgi:SNF2 family DNA or RNA helicase